MGFCHFRTYIEIKERLEINTGKIDFFWKNGKITHQEQESRNKQKIKKQKTSVKYIQENQSWFLKETYKTLAELFEKKEKLR